MTDLPRLSELSPEGFEAELLQAAKREAPSSTLRQATAASLAVAATLAPPAAAAATLGSKSLLALVAKGMIAGTLVTTALVGVTETVRARQRARDSEPLREAAPASAGPLSALSAAPPASAPAVEAPEEGFPPPPTISEVTPEPERAEPSAPPPPAEEKTAPAASPPPSPATPAPVPSVAGSTPGLSDELEAFERAHAAFSRGDMWTAEAALGAYRQSYPGGAFDVEARVLEIEILRARRQTATMQARAREFLAAHPNVPAARRVRNLLEQSGEKAAVINPPR